MPVVFLRQGDITVIPADAIVNAANSGLLGGGGVDGAVHAAGGPEILAECRHLRATRFPQGLPTGQAVATTAGRLPARWVIHAVGPIHRGRPEEPELLAAAYRNSLAVAHELGAATISFPAISTGLFSYPLADAARIALRELAGAHDGLIPTMVLFSSSILAVHAEVARACGIPVEVV
jgi:O-acetyl-ADP-ribose deacetylase (regulator of RNase III)